MDDDLEELILTAWRRIRAQLDDHALAARLARRCRPTLMRPPRAWCIALRASDHRIPSNCHFDPEPHTIALDRAQIIKLASPVRINAGGEPVPHVAKKLGTTPSGVLTARVRQTFRTHYVHPTGGQGKPCPVLCADQPLDPCAVNFATADPAWLWTSNCLGIHLPANYQTTLTRIPVFRSHVPRSLYDEHRHPEIDPVGRKSPSKKLPGPTPELLDGACWYKWSRSGHYLGTDPTNWRKSFQDLGERPRRDRPHPTRAQRKPAPSSSKGSLHFKGFTWQCPNCHNTARVLYLPVPPRNLLDRLQPRLAQCIDIPRKLRPASSSLPTAHCPPPTATFACKRCHNIRFTSSICKDYWNDLITYLTAGLLYGREVPRPAWAAAKRKNKYAPRPTREPSKRRAQIQELLLKGKSYAQISTELGLSKRTVNDYACQIYRQHEVSGHHARRDLAKKLNRQAPPNKPSKRQDIRFPQVLDLLLKGQTHKQIGAALGLKPRTVNCYICMIYRQHGVSGHHAREALAETANRRDAISPSRRPSDDLHAWR